MLLPPGGGVSAAPKIMTAARTTMIVGSTVVSILQINATRLDLGILA